MESGNIFARIISVFILVSVVITGCSAGQMAAPTVAPPTQAPAPIPPTATPEPKGAAIMQSPDFSIQVFLWGSPYVDRDLKLAKDAGFRWIKQMFQWNYIEGKGKGQYEWNTPDLIARAAKAKNLKIVARVDISPLWARDPATDPKLSGPPKNNSDFADFIYALVDRYKPGSPYGEIQAYEIWNEPNLAYEWAGLAPDPAAYTNLLKIAYQAAKKANPDAIIVSAGLSPTTASGKIAMPDVDFLKAMYKAGAKQYFDVLGVHAAGYKAPPELSPDEIANDPRYNHNEPGAGRIYGFRHVEDLRQVMVDNGDSAKRVAVMEFGWTSDPRPNSPYKWHSITEDEKADYVVRAYQFAKINWSPWVGLMTLIYIADPNWKADTHEQYYWAITGPDGSVRPSYNAIQTMLK